MLEKLLIELDGFAGCKCFIFLVSKNCIHYTLLFYNKVDLIIGLEFAFQMPKGE